jgi:hypothetical protein
MGSINLEEGGGVMLWKRVLTKFTVKKVGGVMFQKRVISSKPLKQSGGTVATEENSHS